MARIRGNGIANSIVGTSGADLIYGFGGNDTISGGSGADTIFAGSGNDSASGGGGHDTIFGEAGIDTLRGDSGNDTLEGGTGGDKYFGGTGSDWVSYAKAKSGVGVDLARKLGNFGEALADTFDSIENIIGSNFDDGGGLVGGVGLYGNAGSNIIMGLGGDDTLFSNGGNDTLLGGSGNDIVSGSSGADYLDGGAGIDMIDCGADAVADWVVLHRDAADVISNFDFNDGDKVVLSKKEFGLPGNLTKLTELVHLFWAAGAPTNNLGTSGVKIFYNDTSAGTIYFDKDGSGGVGPILIGKFNTTVNFIDSDFLLIA